MRANKGCIIAAMKNPVSKHILAVIAVMIGLTGCAIQDGARTGLRQLTEMNGLIAFDQVAAERMVYANAIERDEYALFKSSGRQAEIVYITTRHLLITNLVVDRHFDLSGVINGFRHNRSEQPVLGAAFKLGSQNIRYWAKPYQLPVAGKSCGAFVGSWDAPPDELRPSKTLLGYFCAKGQPPLTTKSIEQTIASIGIRGITANAVDGGIDVPPLAEKPSQAELLRRVQGKSGDDHGNTEFPYKIVRHFKRGDDCLYIPDC